MKIFYSVEEFIKFVNNNDELYFDDMFGDNEDNVTDRDWETLLNIFI